MEPLVVPGTLDSLSPIGAYVIAAATTGGLDRKASYRLRLAVDEIATNSIVHGYQETGIQGELVVRADIVPRSVTISLEDSGRAYDPRQAMLPDDLDVPIEQRKVGGLGVYLTVQGVDTFLYERVGELNRNIFIMNVPNADGKAQSPSATESICQVLLIVNNPLNRNMLSRELEALGYRVTAAQDSTQARDQMRIQQFGLVLLHVDLSEGCAEFVQDTKSREHPIPVIVVSSAAREDIGRVSKYLEMGADDYLVEPFSAVMLDARLRDCLERKRLRERAKLFERNEELLKIEHDVEIARTIQLSFLPQTLPQLAGWEVAARFEPAREVAGDFYDTFPMTQGRRLGFVIADVCDKGVPAALFMALVRSLIRALAQQNYPERDLFDSLSLGESSPSKGVKRIRPGIGTTALKEAVLRTNNYIVENHLDLNMFATLFFAVLDPATGQVSYVNAGHNPPAILGPKGVKARLTPTGPAVGIFPQTDFATGQAQLEAGDLLFCFTDGATDAKDPAGNLFTEKRLLSLVAQPSPSANALLSGVEASLRAHISTAAQFDDITMLAVRYAGKAA